MTEKILHIKTVILLAVKYDRPLQSTELFSVLTTCFSRL